MKKLLWIALALLLAMPVLAQDTAESKVVVKANEATNGHTFSVMLEQGVYVNYSNWYIYVIPADSDMCLERLIGSATLFNSATRTSYIGVSPMGMFKTMRDCSLEFEMYNTNDSPVRGTGKVALRKAYKEKSIKLTSAWQKVTFTKGKYRFLKDSGGYQVDPSKPGYEACLGDDSTPTGSGVGLSVSPRFLIFNERVDCYLRTTSAHDPPPIGFAKWR